MPDLSWDRAYRLARRFGLSTADGEDCASEARLRALLLEEQALDSAVTGAAQNAIRRVLRRRSREVCFAEMLSEGEEPCPTLWEEVADPQSDPLRDLLRAEAVDALLREIRRLPEPARSIFVAAVLIGEPYALVAKRSGKSVGAVEQTVHRVRRKLRSLLE